ncbi:MAG: type IV pilus assembly protein PilM [Fimbriimonadales bacterium]
MAKRLTQALGVDIGTQSIKVAGVRLGKDGPVVTGLAKGPTPDNAIDHTGIYDPTALGGALHTLLAQAGMLGLKDVIFSIAGQSSVVVRNLEVPRMSDKELSDHMQWEIQRNIPFAESTVISDFRPVENLALENTQNMEVVMAVSPQSAIGTILELLKAAGCRAAAIDVEPLALGRVLRSCHPADLGMKKVCLVNYGHNTASINMYRESVLAFPRSVPTGGAALTKAIADSSGLTSEEAEARKTSAIITGDPGGDDGSTGTYQPYNPFTETAAETAADTDLVEPAEIAAEVEPEPVVAPIITADSGDTSLFDSFRPQIDEFVAELRRSIDYYRSRGGDIDQIALSGGGAGLKGLGPYISSSLDTPVSVVNPLQGIGVDLPETYSVERASEFAVAVGMGLHIAYD